jgi:hypothetical protein
MVDAFRTKDASWLEKNATSDFVAIDSGRRFTRSESVAQMRQMFQMTSSAAKVSAKILSFKKVGSSYVVTTDTTFNGMLKAPNGQGGKLVDDSMDDMTWVRVGKSWKISIDKTIKEHATLNGKPIRPGG